MSKIVFSMLYKYFFKELFDSLEPKLRAQAERRQEYIKVCLLI